LALALLLAALALPVSPGRAQSGNGLYEPFPEAAIKERAQRYVEGLTSRTAEPGRRYSEAELERGAFVDADVAGRSVGPVRGADAPRGSPTERAGGGGTSEVPLPLQLALLALVLGGAVARTRGRGPGT
jgi:hypothetical protein